MNFLFPAGLFFAALAPVVVAFYLLKVRRRPLAVSSLLLWQQVLGQNKRRSLFQRLRQWWSLLLHLLILALIILALSRPVPLRHGEAAVQGANVLVIDNRARMGAVEQGEPRFAAAVREAVAQLSRFGSEEETAVLTVAGRPQVARAFTRERDAVLATLETVEASEAGGDLEAATALARQLLEGRGTGGGVLVFTDTSAPDDWEGGGWFDVSRGPLENLAITQFAVRAQPNSPGTAEVLAEIANFSATPRSGNVELRIENRLVEVRPFALEPGEIQRLFFPALDSRRAYANSRGWVQARLDTTDSLPLDDTAYAVLPETRPIRVLLAGEGDLFLERALQSEPQIELQMLTAPSLEDAAGFDAVVFSGRAPPDWPWLAEGMPSTLVLGAIPPPLATGAEPFARPLVTAQDRRHPVAWLVDFADPLLTESQVIDLDRSPGWSWTRVLDAARSPLIVAGERLGSGERLVVAAFDPLASDLPLRVAYPLFINNSIRWLAGREQPLETFTAATGRAITLEPGESVLPRALTTFAPLGEAEGDDWQSTRFIPMETGFYQTRTEGRTGWLAASLADPAMSALPSGSVAPPPPGPVPAARSVRWGWPGEAFPLWTWLALAAALLFTLEWWWFHRRRTE